MFSQKKNVTEVISVMDAQTNNSKDVCPNFYTQFDLLYFLLSLFVAKLKQKMFLILFVQRIVQKSINY